MNIFAKHLSIGNNMNRNDSFRERFARIHDSIRKLWTMHTYLNQAAQNSTSGLYRDCIEGSPHRGTEIGPSGVYISSLPCCCTRDIHSLMRKAAMIHDALHLTLPPLIIIRITVSWRGRVPCGSTGRSLRQVPCAWMQNSLWFEVGWFGHPSPTVLTGSLQSSYRSRRRGGTTGHWQLPTTGSMKNYGDKLGPVGS